jgi:hypothetical protein
MSGSIPIYIAAGVRVGTVAHPASSARDSARVAVGVSGDFGRHATRPRTDQPLQGLGLGLGAAGEDPCRRGLQSLPPTIPTYHQDIAAIYTDQIKHIRKILSIVRTA